MAEVYAGFLSHADHEIGRLLDYLEESGQLDNTLIVLVSDNGASGEGGPNGSVNENKLFQRHPGQDRGGNLQFLDVLGSPRTYNHYPTGWACAFNTPFKLWKRYANWEGGTADPMIVSWPARIKQTGVRRQYTHAVDIVPTIYEVLGVEPPEVVKGYTQHPIEGVSFAATFDDAEAKTDKQTQFYSMGGTRAIWHQGWKAAAVSPSAPDMWAGYASQRWELFDTKNDPTECHDLADGASGQAAGADRLWWHGGRPLSGAATREPQRARDPHDGTAAALQGPQPLRLLPAAALRFPSPSRRILRNRSYIDRRRGHDRHRGGGRRSVRARLAVRRPRSLHQGRQAQVRLQLGRPRRADHRVDRAGPDRSRRAVGFIREGGRRDCPPRERSRCTSARQAVGEGKIKTQPGKFSIAGEGLNIGKEGAEPVTDDYPGSYPWAFVGGTIHKAVIDVSGKPFVDLAQEARMAFARD